jgi:hypothetical protein
MNNIDIHSMYDYRYAADTKIKTLFTHFYYVDIVNYINDWKFYD